MINSCGLARGTHTIGAKSGSERTSKVYISAVYDNRDGGFTSHDQDQAREEGRRVGVVRASTCPIAKVF